MIFLVLSSFLWYSCLLSRSTSTIPSHLYSDCEWFPPSYTEAQKKTFITCTGMQAAMDDYYRWRNTLFVIDKILTPAGGYTACLFMGINTFVSAGQRKKERKEGAGRSACKSPLTRTFLLRTQQLDNFCAAEHAANGKPDGDWEDQLDDLFRSGGGFLNVGILDKPGTWVVSKFVGVIDSVVKVCTQARLLDVKACKEQCGLCTDVARMVIY